MNVRTGAKSGGSNLIEKGTDARSFAERQGFREPERSVVINTLTHFPDECQSRGLFFLGLMDQLHRARGPQAHRLVEELGLPTRVQNFGFVQHRDFYKLFFTAARLLHPGRSLEAGMEAIAESFYPVFSTSLAGRTLAAMLSRDPSSVLSRFVDAYRIACPWNEHAFEPSPSGAHRWRCRVEPCDYYPRIIQGICRGMVRGVTGHEPSFLVLSRAVSPREHRYVFEVAIR
jgi:uncharacterized protein (TIGR02265 family)